MLTSSLSIQSSLYNDTSATPTFTCIISKCTKTEVPVTTNFIISWSLCNWLHLTARKGPLRAVSLLVLHFQKPYWEKDYNLQHMALGCFLAGTMELLVYSLNQIINTISMNIPPLFSPAIMELVICCFLFQFIFVNLFLSTSLDFIMDSLLCLFSYSFSYNAFRHSALVTHMFFSSTHFSGPFHLVVVAAEDNVKGSKVFI